MATTTSRPFGAARHVPSPAVRPSDADLRSWGLDPSWSRLVTFDGAEGRPVTWHVLDTAPSAPEPKGTLVCVHGNPSWAYLWVDVLARLGATWRVVAVDQTGMGFSERTGPRRLAQRIEELVAFCRQEVAGPLVLAAHDWGGPVAVGASAHLEIEAMVLANTAVAKPDRVAVPPLIAAARSRVDLACRRTPAFVAGAAAMTARHHRRALRAPYATAERRSAVADFVADIPVEADDPSAEALRGVAATFGAQDHPLLLVWGGRDPVFHDRFLADLRRRRPDAAVHRFADAAHYLPLDVPLGSLVADWLDTLPGVGSTSPAAEGATAPRDAGATNTGATDGGVLPPGAGPGLLAELLSRTEDASPVVTGPDGTLSWRDLAARSGAVAAHLAAAGLVPGDRAVLLVPPGPDLLVAAIGVWRAGGVLVVADATAGLGPLRRLLRASGAGFVLGTPATLAVAASTRMVPGATRLCFGRHPAATNLHLPAPGPVPEPAVDPAALAAVVHTSGATGPAKPVRYTFGALAAQRDVVLEMLGGRESDGFTTSFAPFMLLAPVVGLPCHLADFPVAHPGRLDFDRLDAVVRHRGVATAWLAPAAARSVVATAAGRRTPLATTMLAGAPIPADLVSAVSAVTGGAVQTPYGMTECLPVTDGREPRRPGPRGGTSTGAPLPGCAVVIEPLPGGDTPDAPADRPLVGQILVSAPWMFDGYDGRWGSDHEARVVLDGRRFHRTGDVGYLHDGLLFQLGRLAHVLQTAEGPIGCLAVEVPVADACGRAVAAVGIGPTGTQVVAVVVDRDRKSTRLNSSHGYI